EITSKVLGRIEKFVKEEGDNVKKGEERAKMETLNLEIQLQKDKATLEVQSKQKDLAEAKFNLARQRVERDLANIHKAEADVKDAKAIKENVERSAKNKKVLTDIGAVSESELKNIQTSLNSAEITLFKAKKNLSNLIIGYRDEDLKRANIPIPKDPSKKDEAFVGLNTSIERAELEMAKANYFSTQKNVEATELLLKKSTIKSPLEGIIATKSKYQGEAVKEGEAIFVIVATDQVLIKYNINESEIWKLKKNQAVEFTVDAYPEKVFKGKVHIIGAVIDPQSRTVEVKVISDNPGNELKPGMFSRGHIKSDAKEKIYLIPKDSVLPGDNQETGYIFTVNKSGLLFKKKVFVVKQQENLLEIKGELKDDELIALGNVLDIQEGESVDPNILPKEKATDNLQK
ncbi:MAG: efflux RND transporter periplasmic adaptor subunit, partial [Leptospiraceae bacterium]|nr:efflux RND transporter periplasmic adaptor subunit [Leptospiraceae bacterium]